MGLRCKVCEKSFNSENEERQHLLSKNHLKATSQLPTIYVAGFSEGTGENELKSYFSTYGQVSKLKVLARKENTGRPFAFVTFVDESTLDTVLSSVHCLDNTRLIVSRRKFVKPNTLRKSKDQAYKDICKNLRASTSIQDGIEKLCSSQKLSEADIAMRTDLRDRVTEMLKPYYPECEVHIYGSTMNGFGCKSSDVDLLFLPTNKYCNLDIPKSDLNIVPEPLDVSQGKVSSSQLSLLDEGSHVNFVFKVFCQNRDHFARPIHIPAKCPIINFIDKKNRLLSDISCSNRLVLQNTELFKLYGDMDERVKPLVMTLRCWAKYQGFIRSGEMSSYSFTLMVIFFLQNVQPPVLPSVELLQLDPGTRSHVEAGWECSFSRNYEVFKSSNTQALDDLMWDFFEYYFKFDFVGNIISTASGKVITMADIQNSDNPKVKDFKMSSICIQDPLELSRNVSHGVKHQTLTKIKKAMHGIVSCSRRKNIEKNLMFLFEPLETDPIDSFPSCSIHFNTILSDLYLSKKLSVKDGRLKEMWYKETSQAVLDVLQDGLLIYCEVIDKRTNSIPERLSYSDEDKDLEMLISIQCGIYFRTWTGRNVAMQSLSLSNGSLGNTLETERQISLSVIEKNPALKHTEAKFWFLCDCYAHTKLNILDVLVSFTPLSSSKEFMAMTSFIKSFLPRTVCKVLADRR